MPLVFFDSVFTVFSSLPFQSTRHALSDFCSAIHRPSGATAIALGYPSGLLKSGVVFTFRTGGADSPRPPPAPWPGAAYHYFTTVTRLHSCPLQSIREKICQLDETRTPGDTPQPPYCLCIIRNARSPRQSRAHHPGRSQSCSTCHL